MLTFSLQSGSNGNCIYVEAGPARLVFDAGITPSTAEERIRRYDRSLRDCQALILSHEHRDHIRYAGAFHRDFRLPVYITRPTYNASTGLGRVRDIHYFKSGDRLEFGPVTVHTLRTPHDAVDSVVFVVEFEKKRLAILTDLGNPFAELRALLAEVDGAYLESNYDPRLLEDGPYPKFLKARIRGGNGHVSNEESALLGEQAVKSRLSWVALAHLSEVNNRPELALAAHRARIGGSFPLHLAPRDQVGPMLYL